MTEQQQQQQVLILLPHLFMHSFLDGNFSCVAIINSDAVNIGVHISFQISVFALFGLIPKSGLTSHLLILFLIFWSVSLLFSITAALIYILTNSS